MNTPFKDRPLNGQPIAVRCPVSECDEVFLQPYYPLEFRLRCRSTNEPVNIFIGLDGLVKVIRGERKAGRPRWLLLAVKVK